MREKELRNSPCIHPLSCNLMNCLCIANAGLIAVVDNAQLFYKKDHII